MTQQTPAAASPSVASAPPTGAGTGPWPRHVLLLAAGAVLLRLVLLLGRGDYIAFDEGFYLLLGRSLFNGEGYSLVGIPHIALSPLFPLLAGALGSIIGSWVWAGRIVAVLAAGLLVLPAWAIFRRLAAPRIAFVATLLVAVLPSLAPFVVPFWIGADLWVGAEPLLHLLLYTGVAAWLTADERGGVGRWAACGAAFGFAFLARPEAIITWGLLGLCALALAAHHRAPRRLTGAAAIGLAFLVVAAPYWVYLHGVTGKWTLTGRSVAPAAAAVQLVGSGSAGGGPAAAATLENMLWADDESYERMLYGLDQSGLRLRNRYWGVYPELETHARPVPRDTAGATAPGSGGPAAAPDPTMERAAPADSPEREPGSDRSRLSLYAVSMRMILPLLLWPFVALGLFQPRSRAVLRKELPVSLSLVGTSVAVAALVAVDPRTQLFLVPLLALYAARGFALLEEVVQRRAPRGTLHPGFIELLVTGIAVVWLLGISARRLQLSVTVGSPHHVVAEQNRLVAEALDELVPATRGPVMSWHPALALYADRDWRVLPYAALPAILRYGQAAGAGVAVLSAYYPPDMKVERLDTRYLVLPVPPGPPDAPAFNLRLEPGDSIVRVGTVEAVRTPVDPGGD